MTRRDYVLLAAAIEHEVRGYRACEQTDATRGALGALSELSLEMCDRLQEASSAFDRARFLEACGF